jgi:hypothetical protein
MPIVVASKTRYVGSVTPAGLNVETTVVELGPESDDFMVEGYLSLRNLVSGDTVVLREYIAVDGVNYDLFLPPVTYNGPVDAPVIRFHMKLLTYNMKYKVTITQTSGTVRSFPYAFTKEVQGSVS